MCGWGVGGEGGVGGREEGGGRKIGWCCCERRGLFGGAAWQACQPCPPPTAPHPPGQVSDEGGGIPRSGLPKMWTYLYTTAKSPLEEMERGQSEGSDGPAVLAG